MAIEVNDLCEETILKNGAKQACGKPLASNGQCNYARAHLEE